MPAEPPNDQAARQAIASFLRSFHVLLHSSRLYQKNHPRVLESLETAEKNLRAALEWFPVVAFGIEHDRLALPALSDQLPEDPCGELRALVKDLVRGGVSTLAFFPETNLGELDTLVRALNEILCRPGSGAGNARDPRADLATQLAERELIGIRVNAPLERQMETALASLVAALVACGGVPPTEITEDVATRHAPAHKDELLAALRLIGKLLAVVGEVSQESPEAAARSVQAALVEMDRRTVRLIVSAITCEAPRQRESPPAYLARLAEALVLQFAAQEFEAERVRSPELRALFAQLARELAALQEPSIPTTTPTSAWSAAQWAEEACADRLYERFWTERPSAKISEVLRSSEAWCLPATRLRTHLEQLARATDQVPGGNIANESRSLLLHYARGLESTDPVARHAVAIGLIELKPTLERLWPHQLPGELSHGVLRALIRETLPGIAGLLTAVTECLAQLALARGDYAEFERILMALERAPRGADRAHLAALARRLAADEHWLGLVDAALFGRGRTFQGTKRALDPVLPRLLRRDPERLLDRLALLLTAPSGANALPAMARLLRAVGEATLETLERHLFDSRRRCAAPAIQLLAATQPDRLAAALARALGGWDWSLQDLAITELAQAQPPGTSQAFLAVLPNAHPLVVPTLIDQLGLAQEPDAVPLLLEIAAGENKRLADVFIRIKAVEALGRMRSEEAGDVLRVIVRQRAGLAYAEPAGLRAAAEEALALIENRPSSLRVRATYEATQKASLTYARPRRYLRIFLPSPYPAQLVGTQPAPARVHTISLGGALVESGRRLNVGDSLRLEIRAGLRRIHSTVVVRNNSADGSGVEFVHMTPEDRERLRRLVRRLQNR